MVSMKRIIGDLNLYSRGAIRSRTFLIQALIAPALLMFAFGAIFSFFSGGAFGPTTVYLQNQDNGLISSQFIGALNSTSALRVALVSPSDNFTQYLSDNSLSDGITIPANFSSSYEAEQPVNVSVYGNPSSSSSAIVSATVNGVINAFNLKRYGGSPILGMSQTTVNPQVHKYIDTLVPGFIGLCIILISMQDLMTVSATYKKSKLFRQLSLTPLTKMEWLASKAIWHVFLNALSFLIVVAVGAFVFGANISLTLWIIPFIILGPILFASLGMLAGTLTKGPEAASAVGYVILVPMMLLSGVFYSLTAMPTYLQYAAHVLPLTYIIEGLSAVMIYSNYAQATIDIAAVTIITIIVFVAAAKLFNWRED